MENAKTVRIGVVGISGRGISQLSLILEIPGVVCPAVCDLVPERAENGVKIVKDSELYTGYDVHSYIDYKEMIEKESLDAVMICTTWITHSRIAVFAMEHGMHVATEVGGAASLEECWELVHTSEKTGKFCMLLENCCYDRKEMALFKMVKEGLFGEIINLEGGYRHDLRDEIILGRENIHGRIFNFQHRNGELYPTHQLGPICKVLDINRGNRFLSLVSMSTKARGLNEWIKNNLGTDYDLYGYPFTEGDVVTTVIKTANGETVTLHHDCSLPRPYSRNYVLQGTKGLFTELSDQDCFIALDGVTESTHKYERFFDHIEKFEHPLWKKYRIDGVKTQGHGGMDYLVLSAFVESVKLDVEPPIDVYDTATLMAITCLSEQSVAMGGMPVPVPDFTNGMWIDRDKERRGEFCLSEVCEEFFEEENTTEEN